MTDRRLDWAEKGNGSGVVAVLGEEGGVEDRDDRVEIGGDGGL